MRTSRVGRWFVVLCLCGTAVSAQEPRLRDTAIVRLTFDDAADPVKDSATAGESADHGRVVNGPTPIPSPFWNAAGGQALRLSSAQQQYIELPDAADLDRPNELTFSLLCVNRAAADSAAIGGLVAKRGMQDGRTVTNYGINLAQASDLFQIYVNDGSGFQVVRYSLKEALPARRRIHLTTVLQVADAPGADADSDADDVRIQLFANGQPVVPKASTRGFIQGNEGWITDINPAGLVNDLPMSIGRSEAGGEYFEGIVDEFLLFPRALSAVEARQLFLEVCGADVDERMKEDAPAASETPQVARLSQCGLTIGQVTQIAIVGQHLQHAPQVIVPAAGVTAELKGELKPDRLNVAITVAPDARPGIYPLFVRTERGISAATALSIDALRHTPAQQVMAAAPLAMPGAVTGILSGGQEVRAYFQGQRGQRLVADLELKRLGGKSAPVLELKTATGTPLAIAWGQQHLGHDVRLEHNLPADGLYFVELHDLVYRAPGANAFRLKLGDLKLCDAALPISGDAAQLEFEAVGTGLGSPLRWNSAQPQGGVSPLALLDLPRDAGVTGPWPMWANVTGSIVTESRTARDAPQQIVATSAVPGTTGWAIYGRLEAIGERDAYVLPVEPGAALQFTLAAPSLLSPLAGEIEVVAMPQGQRIAMTAEQPSDNDPTITATVPAGVALVGVRVRDLFERGGPNFFYRIDIAPANTPSFTLQTPDAVLQLPADGSAVVELTVARKNYNGPISLSITGDEALSIAPTQIAAGVSGKILCCVSRAGSATAAASPLVSIVGASSDVMPEVVVPVSITAPFVVRGFETSLVIGTQRPVGQSLEVIDPPTVAFRGASQAFRLRLQRTEEGTAAHPCRVSSLSTETARPKQPGQPAAGTLPVVLVEARDLVPADAPEFEVHLKTPLDVAEAAIELVVVGELLAHEFSERVAGTVYSQPIRVATQLAAQPVLEPAAVSVVAEQANNVAGKLRRTAGFVQPVQVSLIGLPAGYQAPAVEVPPDQDAFQLTVTAPAVANGQPLPNVKLRVTAGGSLIAADQDVAISVTPKPQ